MLGMVVCFSCGKEFNGKGICSTCQTKAMIREEEYNNRKMDLIPELNIHCGIWENAIIIGSIITLFLVLRAIIVIGMI